MNPTSSKVPLPPGVLLKENSWRARWAASYMRSSSVAIVFGQTIHLHGVSAVEFLEHPHWVRHELTHVAQYKKYGYYGFLFRYLWHWMRRGYYNNPFEIAAREAEHE